MREVRTCNEVIVWFLIVIRPNVVNMRVLMELLCSSQAISWPECGT